MKIIWVWLFLVLAVLGGYDAANAEGESNRNVVSHSGKIISSNNNNNTSNGTKGGSDSVLKGDKLKRVGVQVKGIDSTNVDRNNSSNQVSSKGVPDVQSKKGESINLSTMEKGAGKNRLEETKEGTKLGGNGGDGSRVEECDPSNRCIDEVNKVVACLRVPGNESPHLSLLIQNQGKGALTVTISAPDFVTLERTKAELQEKEHTEVKVSITDGVTDTLINVTAGKGRCSLDFRDLVAQNYHKVPKMTYTNLLTGTPTIVVVSLAALLIVVSSWICISVRRRRLLNKGAKYEMLDMELPIAAVGGKGGLEIDDGWDNSWGDDWGDEEAPKTPTLPVTPSLSSKGLAARRLNKDGWKD